jgi:hypothetical protein
MLLRLFNQLMLNDTESYRFRSYGQAYPEVNKFKGMFSEVAKVQAEAPPRHMIPPRLRVVNAQTHILN